MIKGYLVQGLVQYFDGGFRLAVVDEILGQKDGVVPILFKESATHLIDINAFKRVPCHVVHDVAEEWLYGHTVARVVGESVGVAFQLQASFERGVVLVVGIVGEIDGPMVLDTFGEQGDEIQL